MTTQRRAIGYTITQYWCRKCAPEGLTDSHEPMREGDDHGVPYSCDDCGEPLLPCDHEWEDTWHRAYTPEGQSEREIRFCTVADCGDAEYRCIDSEASSMSDGTIEYHPDPEINAGIIAEALESECADLAAGYPPRRWQCECGADHGRGHFMSIGVHRCLACGYVGTGGVMFGTSNPTLPSARVWGSDAAG